MKKLIYVNCISLLLVGCVAGTTEPVISDFNGSSVKVQEPGLSVTPPSAGAVSLASSTCAKAGKSSEYASGRMATEYQVEYLFLCI